MARTRRNPTDTSIAHTIIRQLQVSDPLALHYWGFTKGSLTALDANAERRGGLMVDVKGASFRGRVVIELTLDDTYRVMFWQGIRRGSTPRKIGTIDEVYADMLYEAITDRVMKGSRMNPRRRGRKLVLRRRGKGRRRNPLIGNDGSIFQRRAQQSALAASTGVPVTTLREMLGENFNAAHVAEVYAAAKVGQLSEADVKKAMLAIRDGSYAGLTVGGGRAARAEVEAVAPAPAGKATKDASLNAELQSMDRDVAIARIKEGLRKRSGVSWSVRGSRGSSWGWITIVAPPKRLDEYGGMTKEDQALLSKLLGKQVHHQGESIPASSEYRLEAVDRAEGRHPPRVVGEPYWD